MARRRKSRKSSSGNRSQALRVVNPHAAGIDLGSVEHWVCCPPCEGGAPEVRNFGTDTPSLDELADWLSENGVETVAMESTGVYWIPIYDLLVGRGFEVLLVDTRSLSSVPGRKSDVLDCQWIQQLHACGLLRGSFRPGDDVVKFRSLARMRRTLTDEQSDWLRRIQKELDQMNVRVHRAVSDISGVTGMTIIRAVVDGERNPAVPAALRDRRCRKNVEQIERELTGTWRDDHLLNLETALRMYDFIRERIEEIGKQIAELLERYRRRDGAEDAVAPEMLSAGKAAATQKRGQEPMRQALFAFAGVDLTRIPGINVGVAEVLLSEIGPDLTSFPTQKQFVSYLRLAPSLGISGGKPVRNRRKVKVGCHRAREALRLAAVAAGHSNTALGAYYSRIAVRKGANVAVFATARKIAEYVYRMLCFGSDYIERGLEQYEEQCRKRRLLSLQRKAREMGCLLIPQQESAVS